MSDERPVGDSTERSAGRNSEPGNGAPFVRVVPGAAPNARKRNVLVVVGYLVGCGFVAGSVRAVV